MFEIIGFFEKDEFYVTPIRFNLDLLFHPVEVQSFIGHVDLRKHILKSPGYIENIDYIVFKNNRLKELKELCLQSSNEVLYIPENASHFTMLTEYGLYNVMFKTHSNPVCVNFRIWITTKIIPKIIRKKISVDVETPKLSLSYLKQKFKAGIEIARLSGLDGNQAILGGAKAVKNYHGIQPTQLIELELKSEQQELLLTPTEVGARLGLSAVRVNKILESLWLQEAYRFKGKKKWKLDKAAIEDKLAVYLDTNKKHSDGTPVQQIKWYESIVEIVKNQHEFLKATK